MEFEFCMQDPTDPDTRYLFEAIIGAAAEAAVWRGIFAFASRNGVNHLVEDPVIQGFMQQGGEVDLIVGIDAVTNRQTLERLQELEAKHRTFRPRVFWNETGGLFHPKISLFGYADGRQKLIIGSGNLTPGGLMHNFEAYSVISTVVGEEMDLSSLDDFLERHEPDIRGIDNEALERAARNLVRVVAGGPRAPRIPQPRRVRVAVPAIAGQVEALDRILIAVVPRAGGRWAQVHFNADVVDQYFRISDRVTQRVYLTAVDPAGQRGEEEVRPCVFSETNRNHKIEIGAAKGLDYPDAPPILVFRERQVRCFDYMLLMPNAEGYRPLTRLLDGLPTLGRGLKRSITNLDHLRRAWPACPLLTSVEEAEKEI